MESLVVLCVAVKGATGLRPAASEAAVGRSSDYGRLLRYGDLPHATRSARVFGRRPAGSRGRPFGPALPAAYSLALGSARFSSKNLVSPSYSTVRNDLRPPRPSTDVQASSSPLRPEALLLRPQEGDQGGAS